MYVNVPSSVRIKPQDPLAVTVELSSDSEARIRAIPSQYNIWYYNYTKIILFWKCMYSVTILMRPLSSVSLSRTPLHLREKCTGRNIRVNFFYIFFLNISRSDKYSYLASYAREASRNARRRKVSVILAKL
jgi:hypothetical protein